MLISSSTLCNDNCPFALPITIMSNVIKGNYLLAVAEDSELGPRFLILPSPPPSLSLMIKSIAVQELMMPQEVPLPDDQPSDQATSAVEHSLDAVSCGPLQCYKFRLMVFGI